MSQHPAPDEAERLVGYPVEPARSAEAGVPDAGMRFERLRADDPDRIALQARIAAAGPHVEAVRDVGTAPNGDVVLVLEALPVRLVDLLEVPGWPTAGEAVTVLVPLLDALERMHAAGVAHGAVRPAAVRFDPRGAPVLCGFEQAVLRQRGAAAFEAARHRDREAAVELVRGVLGATGAPQAAQAQRIDDDPSALVDALFALAEPTPVRLEPRASSAGRSSAGDADAPGGQVSSAAWALGDGLEASPNRISGMLPAAPATRRTHPPGSLIRSTVTELRLPALLDAARGAARTVRPRVWAAAAASVALLVAALVLLPGRGADAVSTPGPAAVRSPPAPRSVLSAAPGAARSMQPVSAARVLLTARARCLSGSSPGCLARIDAAGSPVDTADRAAMAAGVVAVLPEGGEPRLLSFRAGSAVLDVHGVTVLAVREPEGWRLRDVIAKPTT